MLVYPGGESGAMVVSALHSPTGDPLRELQGHLDDVLSLQIFSDNSRVVSAGRDGMIFIWEGSLQPTARDASPAARDLSIRDEDVASPDSLDGEGAYVPPILRLG